MKKRLLTIIQYSLFLGLGIFLVWWSIHKMDDKNWEDCKTSLRSARYYLFIPVFFILAASHISRSIRWKILMKPMGYEPKLLNVFFSVMIGYLANLAIPRLGEVLKCTILSKYEKVPSDKLVGTILIERAVDIVSLIIVFVIALLSQASIIGEYAKATIRENIITGSRQELIIKLSVFILCMVLLYFLLKIIFRKFAHITFVEKIRNVVKGISAGLGSIRNMQNKWAFLFHSLFIWCCYLGGTYLGFHAIAETSGLPVAAAFPVLAFASIGMIITPGGIGTYPIFVMEVMLLYNIKEPFGFANGNLQWLAQFLIILLVGFISLMILPHYNRKIRHQSKAN